MAKKKLSGFVKVIISIIVLVCVAYIGYVVADLTAPSYVLTLYSGVDDQQETIVVKRGHTTTLPTPTKEGYDFGGWFVDGKEWTNKTKVKSDSSLTAKWIPKKYEITFIIEGKSYVKVFDYDSMPSYDGVPQKDPTPTTEFVFTGFEPELSIVKGNATYTAQFVEQIRHFNINVFSNYEGACTISGAGKKEYNSDTTISFVAETGFLFAGYYENGTLLSKNETLTLSAINSDRNIEIRFQLDGDKIDVQFIADGKFLSGSTITLTRGEKASAPSINSSELGMNGYEIVNWYKDAERTQEFNFDTTPFIRPTTLYGKWEYKFYTGFFKYKSKFDSAITSGELTILSEEELKAFVEYVQFFNIESASSPKLTLSYKTFTSETGLKTYISTVIGKSTFYNGCLVRYSYTAQLTWVKIFIDKNDSLYEATKFTSDSGLVPQMEYALLNYSSENARSDDFNDFNIEKVTNTISVTNSTQLIYALEKGYRPVPVTGSVAEKVYNKAKEILRKICNDNMTDIQKARAIYDYLILNVAYDYDASADSSIVSEWNNYRIWYAEGALLDGKAVCDGFCKAYIILAEIENIPAIRVTGNKHAWNRVYLNNNWYGVDATHGNLKAGYTDGFFEALTYNNFMFTDEYKTSLGYTSNDYTDYKATTAYDIYANTVYGNGSNQFSLLIESSEDFDNMLSYLSSYTTPENYYKAKNDYCTFEIELGDDITISDIQVWASYSGLNITSWIPQRSATETTKAVYTFRFTKAQLGNISVI